MFTLVAILASIVIIACVFAIIKVARIDSNPNHQIMTKRPTRLVKRGGGWHYE